MLIDFLHEDEPSISLLDEAVISEEIASIQNDDNIAINFAKWRPKYPKRHRPYISTRDKWYNNYKVPQEGYAKDKSDIKKKEKRPSEPGKQVSAIEAINWTVENNIDCRPKIYDNKTTG